MKLNTNPKAKSIEEYFNLSDAESLEIEILALRALLKVSKENYETGEFHITQLMDELLKYEKKLDSPEKLAFAMCFLTRYICKTNTK